MQGKNVFVTGATGFIGRALCDRLLAEGALVRGLARSPAKGEALAAAGAELVAGDITDLGRMSEVVAGAEVVFHLAAYLGPGTEAQYQRGTVEATRHLAEASARAGVGRFVYVSSMMALGCLGKEVVDESRPLREYGDRYADSKIRAERALHEIMATTNLEIVIARPGMVYGPRSPGWTIRIVRLVKAGHAPLVDGGRGTSYPVYLDNLLDGLILCATRPRAANQTFNFVDDPVTWAEYFGAFAAMVGEPVHMWRLPRWALAPGLALLDPFVRRRNLRCMLEMLAGRGTISSHKAKGLLGWVPNVSFEEGMRRSEAWLREAGYL